MPHQAWSPIRADRVGAIVGRRVVEVSTRMTTAYAAGIGALDEIYLDDARPEGVVAPLSYIVALEWPVLVAPDYLEAIGRDAVTVYEGLVHAFQDSAFARPVRPGMKLEVCGRITEISPTPAGTLVVCKVRTVELPGGDLVGESWFGSLFRLTPSDGLPATLEHRPLLRARADLPEHEDKVRTYIDIPRGLPHVYTECAQIWNPIHTERAYALASGLPDIILHGTCTWAIAMQRLAAVYRPRHTLPFRRFAARFSRMVIPGTNATLEHAKPRDGSVSFVVRNAEGELALTHALAELA
jgi:acyl dehydratase